MFISKHRIQIEILEKSLIKRNIKIAQITAKIEALKTTPMDEYTKAIDLKKLCKDLKGWQNSEVGMQRCLAVYLRMEASDIEWNAKHGEAHAEYLRSKEEKRIKSNQYQVERRARLKQTDAERCARVQAIRAGL
jgi:hypothetical protein